MEKIDSTLGDGAHVIHRKRRRRKSCTDVVERGENVVTVKTRKDLVTILV